MSSNLLVAKINSIQQAQAAASTAVQKIPQAAPEVKQDALENETQDPPQNSLQDVPETTLEDIQEDIKTDGQSVFSPKQKISDENKILLGLGGLATLAIAGIALGRKFKAKNVDRNIDKNIDSIKEEIAQLKNKIKENFNLSKEEKISSKQSEIDKLAEKYFPSNPEKLEEILKGEYRTDYIVDAEKTMQEISNKVRTKLRDLQNDKDWLYLRENRKVLFEKQEKLQDKLNNRSKNTLFYNYKNKKDIKKFGDVRNRLMVVDAAILAKLDEHHSRNFVEALGFDTAEACKFLKSNIDFKKIIPQGSGDGEAKLVMLLRCINNNKKIQFKDLPFDLSQKQHLYNSCKNRINTFNNNREEIITRMKNIATAAKREAALETRQSGDVKKLKELNSQLKELISKQSAD